MTTLVFGIGIGLFTVLSLWLMAGVICLISLQTRKIFGIIALSIVGIITIVLISIPKTANNSKVDIRELYNQSFFWRTLLAAFLAASSVIVLFVYVKLQLLAPVKAERIKHWVL